MEEGESGEGERQLNSPGGRCRLDHTGSPALSQYPVGEHMMEEHGQPPHHLTTQ